MKITSYSLLVVSILVFGYAIMDYKWYSQDRLDHVIEKGNTTATQVKQKIDSITLFTKESSDMLAIKLQSGSLSISEIKRLLVLESTKLNHLAGISIAFAPYAINPDQRLLGLFYKNTKRAFIRIDEHYDYTDSSLATSKWYTEPVTKGIASISKPYFGEAAQELVIDYSTPIFITNKNGNKRLYAVLSYSLAPDKFTEVVNSFVQGNSGYAYLTNRDGDIITHPNRSYILKHKVLDYNKGEEHNSLADLIMQNASGHVNYISPYTLVTSMLFFQTGELTNWKIAVVYSRADLMGNPLVLERKIIHIGVSASLFLVLLLLLILNIKHGETNKLWYMSVAMSILLVLNITLVWIIQLDVDYSEELENRTRVYSNNALNSFVYKKNYEQKLLGKSNYLQIPTGIFIEELLVTDSYNMSASGTIWQKWPVEHDLEEKTGFHFIQASPSGRSVIVELMSKERINESTWLYKWNFNATLRVFFDYNQYPLDQHYIDIKLIYPDMTDKIMLVPDFASYEVLNPSARPGMSDIIFLPRHRIIASYFSFSSLDMKTFFGQNRQDASSEYEALEYNIVIKRRFLTPFVSFIIPFILGASIIFFLLYSLNKDKEDKSGVTVMGVVQGMAALFFSMLLAHITIRNRIPSPQITYIESYYFVIYLMIALLILLVVMYTRSNRYKILDYRDNLIMKLAYWPVLVGLLYIITLIKFY